MRVLIAVIAGPHQGQVFTFTGHDTFLVGRSKQAHFRLAQKDEYFSRIHFLVEINPPHCVLMDMNSTNGTLVNGSKVTLAYLKDGDVIEGGQTRMRVTIEFQDDEPVTRAGLPESHPASRFPTQDLTAAWQPAFDLPVPPPTSGPLVAACRVCSAPAAEPAPPLAWPLCAACRTLAAGQEQPFPGYWLVRKLGEGGMGVVHLALRHDGRLVALKTFRPAIQARATDLGRFLREVAILGRLQHPNIVRFLGSGDAGGQLYFVMDYIDGVDGAALVQRHGPLPAPRAVGIIAQLLDALAYAHASGYVHRDVKPSNLLVCEQGGADVVKVLDFGLARAYQESKLSGLTLAGAVCGSAPFMAPEQISDFRGAKPSVDQYAAAATLYYLLTGKYTHDFPPEFQARLLMLVLEAHVPIRTRRPDVPDGLAVALDRALAKDPAQRFPDTGALRQALLPYA